MASNKDRELRAVAYVSEEAPSTPKALYKEMCMMFAELAGTWLDNRPKSGKRKAKKAK